MMAENLVMPIMPEIGYTERTTREFRGDGFFELPRPASALASALIAMTNFCSALRMTGVMEALFNRDGE